MRKSANVLNEYLLMLGKNLACISLANCINLKLTAKQNFKFEGKFAGADNIIFAMIGM